MDEDKLITLVVQNTEDIRQIKEKMATKDELQDVKDSLGNTLDKILKLVEKKDQELTLVTHGLRQLEDKVEEHDKIIKRIAPARAPA